MSAYVKLLAFTPEPEKTVAMAAKLCYSQTGIEDIADKLDQKGTERFLNMLVSLGHESPIEHVSFTFGIENVSRSLLAQLTRHRIASFSVQSQRYVRYGSFSYVTPPAIEKTPEARREFQLAMEEDQKHYEKLTGILKEKHEKELMKSGQDEKTAKRNAEKMAIEDARFVLPNACETKIVLTMNARSLYNFFRHRCCSRAQWEIRDLADQMLIQVKKAAPVLFASSGPACVAGPCPEGKMSCGKVNLMREKYASL